jgi:hypothetical protein
MKKEHLVWIHNLLVSDQVTLRGGQLQSAVQILDEIRKELKVEDDNGDSPDPAE